MNPFTALTLGAVAFVYLIAQIVRKQQPVIDEGLRQLDTEPGLDAATWSPLDQIQLERYEREHGGTT